VRRDNQDGNPIQIDALQSGVAAIDMVLYITSLVMLAAVVGPMI